MDAIQRIAQEMAGEDGCCRLFGADGQCCMTDKAKLITTTVLHEIGKCGLDTGTYIGVLDRFAMRNGLTFDRAALLVDTEGV